MTPVVNPLLLWVRPRLQNRSTVKVSTITTMKRRRKKVTKLKSALKDQLSVKHRKAKLKV